MKNIYFAAVLAILAFSACSNDPEDKNPSSSSNLDKSSNSNSDNSSSSGGSSSPGGCLFKVQGADFQCIEENQVYGEQSCVIFGGEWVNSCPPGGVTCEIESGGIPSTSHFYDTEHNLCSSLPSSSSIGGSDPTPSSSSIGGGTQTGVCYFEHPDIDWSFCVNSISDPITSKTECDLANLMMGGEYTTSFKTSCPPNPKYTCPVDDEIYYTYGEDADENDCEIFEYEEDEGEG